MMLKKDYITSNMRMSFIYNSNNLSTKAATEIQFIKMIKYIKCIYPINYKILLETRCNITDDIIKNLSFDDNQFRYLLDLYLKEHSNLNQRKELLYGTHIN